MNTKPFFMGHAMRTFALALAVMLWAGLLAGCAGPTLATLSSTSMTFSPSSQPVDSQVVEDGYDFNSSVSLQGLKGKTVEVAAYHDGTFLGVTQLTPDQDAYTSHDFKIFVPASKLYSLPGPMNLQFYVTDPSDREHYHDARVWTFPSLSGDQIKWEVTGVKENADLGNGERGIKITANLTIAGYMDHSFVCSLRVQDKEQHDFSADAGGPISVVIFNIKPPYTTTVWKDLEMWVSYSRLASLPPSQEITLTPVLTEGDDTQVGKVHVSAFAGGTADDVKANLQKQIDADEAKIDALQQQIQKAGEAPKP